MLKKLQRFGSFKKSLYLCTVETKCTFEFDFFIFFLKFLTEAVVKHPQLFFQKKVIKIFGYSKNY